MSMRKLTATLIAAVATSFMAPASHALSAFSDNFESPAVPAPCGAGAAFACVGNGWINFINQFNTDGSFNSGYQYNNGQAPAEGPQVSALATGEGGPLQGDQVLSVYSDYDNRGFQQNGNPAAVQTNVYQEQFIGADVLGETWIFSFDAKRGNIESPAAAAGFIAVFDDEFNRLANPTVDTSDLPLEWARYSVELLIDPGWEGRRLQFGFLTDTGNDVPSGNFYDNVDFNVIPVPAAVWLFASALGLLAGIRRKFAD
ncbi:MAG: hypothetical protein QNJ73_00375 [Gammaproteobacteria bacterium]|nr:hypothetical protein [Gammaproteobacteria bacterium]